MRPQGINDLHIMWAIRDIPSSIVNYIEKSILYTLLAIIGNRESCKLSCDQISSILGMSNRCLRNYLNKLAKKKFIHFTSKVGCRNEYFLNYIMLLQYASTPTPHAEVTPLTPTPHAEVTPLTPAPRAEVTPTTPAPRAEVKGEPRHDVPTTPAPRADIREPRENLKDREREQPSLSFFSPTDEHKVYATDFRLNIEKELNSFKEYYRGQTLANLDFMFRRWLEKAKAYAQDHPVAAQSRAYMEWGAGHPDWERMHGGKK